MVVFVEASVLEDPALARDPRFQGVRDRLQTFRDGMDDLQVIIPRILEGVLNHSHAELKNIFQGSHRLHRLSGRRRNPSVREFVVPTIGTARYGVPSRLLRVPHALRVRQFPGASDERVGRWALVSRNCNRTAYVRVLRNCYPLSFSLIAPYYNQTTWLIARRFALNERPLWQD